MGLFVRALRYVGPVRERFAVKGALTLVSLLPLIFFPWPLKILIDHVVLGRPIGDEASHYPAFVEPLLNMLRGATPYEMAWILVGVFFVLMIVVGGFSTSGPERDIAHGTLGAGQDTATRTENEANRGWSFASGLFGIFEYRWTIRLSQSLNHHYPCSPVETNTSISRLCGSLETCDASSSSRLVSPAMAETTTATLAPWSWARLTRAATARIRSGLATEVPPYFCTMRRAMSLWLLRGRLARVRLRL